MATLDIARLRLTAQRLVNNPADSLTTLVNGLGAVQAQDFAGAKWAIGQRLLNSSDDTLTEAFNKGEILRTHVLRPTWHFVTPENIRWMVDLTAPRIKALSAYYLRQLAIDEALSEKSSELIVNALRSHTHLTKAELTEILAKQGIDVSNPIRATFLVGIPEIAGLICSGPLKGKQHTYALMSERAPGAKLLPKDEALAKLATMYFFGHGPATLKDFIWWSGLSAKDAANGLASITSSLKELPHDGTSYWHAPSLIDRTPTIAVRLLPNYDEYIIAFADRSKAIATVNMKKVDERNNVLFNNTVVVNGVVRGTWKRPAKNRKTLEIHLFSLLSGEEREALDIEIEAYSKFSGIPLTPAIVQL